MAQDDATVGFVLPVFESAQNVGCPVDVYAISSSNSDPVVAPAGLNAAVDDGTGNGNQIVKPTDTSVHQAVTFFVRVSATDGLAYRYMGPYTLEVGCLATSVSFTDDPSFDTSIAMYVGEPVTGSYTYLEPSSSQTYCTIQTNIIMNRDGTTHNPVMVSPCTPDPCTVFDLVDTINPDTFYFKIQSNYQNL